MRLAAMIHSGFLILSLNLFFTNESVSQTKKVSPVIPAGLQGVIGMTSGDYSFIQFDKTKAMETLIAEISKRNQKDLKYFKESIALIDAAFLKIAKENIYAKGTGLKFLSDQSSYAGVTVTSVQFLEAINNFELSKLELETAFGRIASITSAFPSQNEINVDGTLKTNLPNYGQVNFQAAIDFYTEKLEKVTLFLSNLPFNILLPSKIPHLIKKDTGKGLILDAPAFQYSAADVLKYQKEVYRMRSWSPTVRREVLTPYTTYIKTMVQEFIKTYGTSERYRYDASTEKLMKSKITEYIDYFYGRSILRFSFGVPLGVVGIDYAIETFNTDFFFSSNSLSFREEIVFSPKDMVSIEKSYENAYKASNSRSKSVFGENINFLDRINTAMVYLSGKNRLAVANKMMLDLLYKDFKEEQILLSSEGFRGLKAAYTKRYKSNPEQTKFFATLKNKYMDILSPPEDGQAADPLSNYGRAISPDSPLGLFQKVTLYCENKELELGQAAELERTIQNMMKFAEPNQANRKKRVSDL